jgi:hypothetical protein
MPTYKSQERYKKEQKQATLKTRWKQRLFFKMIKCGNLGSRFSLRVPRFYKGYAFAEKSVSFFMSNSEAKFRKPIELFHKKG